MSAGMLIKLPEVKTEITIDGSWFQERDALVAEAQKVTVIGSSTEYEVARSLMKKITSTSNRLDKMRLELARPYKRVDEILKAKSDEARKPLEELKGSLGVKLSDWAEAEQRRVEEERRKAEETERIEAEKQVAEKAKAEEAATALGLDETTEEPVTVVAATVIQPEAPKLRGVQTRIVFDVMDNAKVPRPFLSVDERKIKEWIKINEESIRKRLNDAPENSTEIISGVLIKIITTVTAR